VLEAAGGDEALNLTQVYRGPTIALLLTDVVMPRMSGKLLVERLAARYPALKVLFMSGYAGAAITENDRLAPGAAFLQKPFSPATLARTVRAVLDQSLRET
jgi:FixJ family two-component response regulator